MNEFKYSNTNKRYHTLDYYYKNRFNEKVFKVSLNAGFNCPNIDGTVGYGGCIYCSKTGSGEFAGNKEDAINWIQSTVSEANVAIFKHVSENPDSQGMGTTIVLVAKISGNIYYLSIGDSRLYYVDKRKENIEQITVDDTYVNELLKKNLIKETFKPCLEDFILFLYVVLDNGRIDKIFDIHKQFVYLFNEENNIKVIEVISSSILSPPW